MAVPRFLLRVIDPAQVYFDRNSSPVAHRGGPSLPRGAVVFGPDVPGGSRTATANEVTAMAEESARHRAEHEAALTEAKRQWAQELRRAVDELLDRGTTQMIVGDQTVDARVIRFWRGDHLLHTATRAPNGGGQSLSRISRDPRRGGPDVLTDYLARAATKG